MATKATIKAKELNLDAFNEITANKPNNLCTVGILLAELRELSEEKADLLQSHLNSKEVGITNIQLMILKAGFHGRGWHQLSNHRQGLCMCAKAGE